MPDDLGFAAYYVLALVLLVMGAFLVQLCRGIWRGLTGRTGQDTTPAEQHAEQQHS